MNDTIAACATAWGHAAIAVVRVSGPGAFAACARVVGSLPPARHAAVRSFRDEVGRFDEGVVTVFPGPRSYTGEDIVELAGHGNPLLVARLLRALGVRPARPGEFTRRAFLAGRMDLVRAEAVLATIEARSEDGVELARAGLDGRLLGVIEALRSDLVDVCAELEAVLDYPGEDLLVGSDAVLAQRLESVARGAAHLADSWRAARIAVEGARVVLAGPVNAGKSSLFNALLGRPRAIVSPQAGTTRDAVEAPLQLREARLTLVDTAGERDAVDPIEAEGVALARSEAAGADLVLRCVPPGQPLPTARPGELRVSTLCDLAPPPAGVLAVSSRTGEGMEALRTAMLDALRGEAPGGAGVVLTSARQAELLARVAAELREAAAALPHAGAAVAVELGYSSLEALAELSGSTVREAVLDRLFARFCIGK